MKALDRIPNAQIVQNTFSRFLLSFCTLTLDINSSLPVFQSFLDGQSWLLSLKEKKSSISGRKSKRYFECFGLRQCLHCVLVKHIFLRNKFIAFLCYEQYFFCVNLQSPTTAHRILTVSHIWLFTKGEGWNMNVSLNSPLSCPARLVAVSAWSSICSSDPFTSALEVLPVSKWWSVYSAFR